MFYLCSLQGKKILNLNHLTKNNNRTCPPFKILYPSLQRIDYEKGIIIISLGRCQVIFTTASFFA